MLQLKEIKKDYFVAGEPVHALKGISVNFRKSEFVSILGPSGCGKTTLLNIIGGLDKYTSGDLVIAGKSTKEYGDRDWDTYRNHSIGFIFQSYHLIPHQTILQNVELALMIAGVSKAERRQRAIDALDKVGLKDKINNRPNQLSGGQAQRVAIARALINDPEIVLADEPTGALDSVTSVQIMELLKEISKDRLVIMVTHNPELAEQYSTRIVRLLDGEVVGDSMPFDGVEKEAPAAELKEESAETAPTVEETPAAGTPANKGRKKKTAMSIGMAMGLSFKNLLSKRKRTTMVSVAGSIGIIGVSMVLAISSGVRGYIADMENDMLSGFPVTVTETAIDFTSLMDAATSSNQKVKVTKLKDKVYVDSLLETLMSFNKSTTTNVITEPYKHYLDSMPAEYYNALQYDYGTDMSNYLYTDFTHPDKDGNDVTDRVSVTGIRAIYTSVLGEQPEYSQYASMISTIDSFAEVPDNYEYVLSQYDILASVNGKTEELSESELKEIFQSKDSLIMVVDENEFTDLNFGQYGYMTQTEFLNFAYKAQGSEYDQSVIDKYAGKWLADEGKWAEGLEGTDFSLFLGDDAKTFTWYPNDVIYSATQMTDRFTIKTNTGEQTIMPYVPIMDESGRPVLDENGQMKYKAIAPYKYNPYSKDFSGEGAVDMKVKVILQKKSSISYGCLTSGLYYTKALTDHMLATSRESEIGKYLNGLENESDYPLLMPYEYRYTYPETDNDRAPREEKGTYYMLNSGDMMSSMMGGSSSDILKVTPNMVGAAKLPVALNVYPVDFEYKSLITDYMDAWNDMCEAKESYCYTVTVENGDGTATATSVDVTLDESMKITYSDSVGLIIGMVNTMINIITIALVAFTALSLVVSTVMIGIITYVSVVERIKEIGILRAVGARKKDIKRLFNAETFIIGLVAGLIGILITYILSLIINLIVFSLAGIWGIAALPWWQAIIMVILSVALTLVSGLIPAAAAAKKDPVVALRTE